MKLSVIALNKLKEIENKNIKENEKRSKEYEKYAITYIKEILPIEDKVIDIIDTTPNDLTIRIEDLIFRIYGSVYDRLQCDLVKTCSICNQIYTHKVDDIIDLGKALNRPHWVCENKAVDNKPITKAECLEEIIREIVEECVDK